MVTTSIPATFNVSGVFGSIASNNASTSSTFTVGILGTIGTGVTGSINSPTLAVSPSSVGTTYGTTSDVYNVYNAFYSQNTITETYIVPIADYTAASILAGIQALKDQEIDLFISAIGGQVGTDGVDVTTIQASIAGFETAIVPRWAYDQSLFGSHVTASVDTLANLTTLGKALNSEFSTVVGFPAGSPDSPAVLAGYVGAVIATKMSASPATPLQGFEVAAQPTALIVDTFGLGDRNTLYNNGISATYQKAGIVYVDTIRTTYQTDASGDEDDSYADVETMFTNAAFVSGLKSYLSSLYMGDNSKILVDDGSSISVSGSQNVTTPLTVRASIAAYCTIAASNFWIEDVETTSAGIVVTRSGNKLSCYVPYQISGKLRQIDFTAAFSLSS